MRTLLALLIYSMTVSAVSAQNTQGHIITHAGENASAIGASTYFTGHVRTDSISRADIDSHYNATYVTFEPNARTFWHTHPAGQRLLIVFGKGLVGLENGPVHVVRAGDSVWCPAGVKHWHGATAETAMTHIALTNFKEGKNVQWLEAVSDEQYSQSPMNP